MEVDPSADETAAHAARFSGHTLFPVLGMSVPPRAGCGTVWWNVDPDLPLRSVEEALHSGLPILAGEKWGLNVWVKRKIGDPFSMGL